jgi:translocator protein
MIRKIVGLCASMAICFAAAGIGGIITSSSVGGWYQELNKPTLTPPDWLFGPVWSVLYFLMALAVWLIWEAGGCKKSRAVLGLFALQLVLNVGWSALFFGLRRPGLAFAEILVLWLAIAATTVGFWKRSIAAGVFLLPYLAWTSFAAVLNFAIWRLNA